MLYNFFVIAIRNILRQKVYSIINIGNLAVGFACSILIILFVMDEMSYDRFHQNADRIYRINARGLIGNTEIHQTYTCAPLPAAMMNDYPGIESIVRILHFSTSNIDVRYEDVAFTEKSIIAADSNFFDIFSFPLLKGNPKKALTGPNRALISESTARKYFGSADPIGKVLKVAKEFDIEITGVYKDIPHNSHFHFDFLISLTSMPWMLNKDQWMNNNFKTYLLLKKGTDAKALEAKFSEFVKKYVWPTENDYKKFREAGNKWEYFLQPITAIHLTSDLNGEFEANGNRVYVIIFFFAAIFIIIIAAVNFTNLSTAKSEKRAREVGIRKVIGSTRNMLISQFLCESVFLSLSAMFIAWILTVSFMSSFNALSGKSFSMMDLIRPGILTGMIGMALFVGILAGIYPGLFLSSYQPTLVLKSGSGVTRPNSHFRGILVVIQFFISVCLITGTLVIFRQLKYFQNKNLGFDKNQIVLIHGTDKLENNFNVFRDKLLGFHGIKSVSGSNTVPGREFNNWGVQPEGMENAGWLTLNVFLCDTAFLRTYSMSMAEGRFFSSAFPNDTASIIINKNAAELLGWKDPIGKKMIIFGNSPYTVIGVINDFHYESLHQVIRPMGILRMPSSFEKFPATTSVKIFPGDPSETIDFIKNQWKSMGTGLPFDFSFFDEDYQQLYQNETKTGRVFLLFSVLAIGIASLGLFALSSYLIERRTKEIGIRKVNGAGSMNIILMLSRDYTKWVLIAIILAIPASLYGMHKWLENFAYKTTIPFWVFLSSALLAIGIAWLSVGIQTIKASYQNPAKSLRYE
jgi:putative ABC transport system permease protein